MTANIITLVLLKIFVFATNRLFVFMSCDTGGLEILKEFIRFLLARVFTNFIDFFGLVLLVEVFRQDMTLSKAGLAVMVVLLNFILSKRFVFKEKTCSRENI